ncbi:A disintegrin and metalloproteinase with thrombospondin motifs 7 [Eupeodes corollae]|uniref:A disintegrin and metalloproteinase with thrombospondin motifs 7 n=1 Tax=Eupeodes corollae TaxID=290404 RepID=UPI0024932C40|nr:A disintegrin and metalloproteinase with thrombospondin motifs 7 [Eupeodes corollae]
MDANKLSFLYISSIICCWGVIAEQTLYGKHSDELISGRLVTPRKVNRHGEHVSHNLTHHHDRNNPEDLHFHIDLDKETLHLELEPHTYFMAPNLIIERHRRDLRFRKKPKKNINCHYHGKIRGHSGSNVALSACDGLVGHIKTKNSEYYIEPSKHHEKDPKTGHHPHVVFHRSSLKEKKKKNRNKSNNKKKHHINNCDTKEPRRHTETRIEWQSQGKVIVQGGRKVRHRQRQAKSHSHSHSRPQQNQNQRQNQTAVAATTTTKPTDAAENSPRLQRHHHQHQHQHHHHQKDRLRKKRSISSPRHVETLIVADSTMVAFHDDVETYLLTIMNVVSSLYKDPTIGNFIEVIVVKILLIEEDEAHPDLNLTNIAGYNLDKFCEWQYKLNSDSDEYDPYHHDVAILITRIDICGKDCGTLGVANLGGMCKPTQSCSVNEDNGIALSHTIAHELGHNFGMFHDTMKIGCSGRSGSMVHIMMPDFQSDSFQVSWSNCSRKYITNFLDQGLGNCLDNTPAMEEYKYPDLPPGAMYNAEVQCRLQNNITDESIALCQTQHLICSQLWCRKNEDECISNMVPTASGTSCGKHKWCQNGQCVPMEEVSPRDGGWGNWSQWSECSRSCGGGVSIQQRECNNPVPANGGVFCIGERRRYIICNKEPCPEGEPSFRAQQCSYYNSIPYRGEFYKWLPYFDKFNPCKLFCTDVEGTVTESWGDMAANGTPCQLGTNNICIDGICKKVGCDWVVDSDIEEDRCGVCAGNGENCKPVEGIFVDDFNVTGGYVEIITIPGKARQIVIKEVSNSKNFLAIGKANSSEFYLNGNRQIYMPGDYTIANAEALYDRVDHQETITIPHSIEHSITLYVIVTSSKPNKGIYYEFTLPVINTTSVQDYTWKLSDWTACTATCGGGVQYRIPLCFESGKSINEEELCWSNANNSIPQRISRRCNEIPCPAHWWIGQWQLCSVTCKIPGSPSPVKRRSIMCLDQNDEVLAESMCNNATRPVDVESCGLSIPICSSDMKNDILLD